MIGEPIQHPKIEGETAGAGETNDCRRCDRNNQKVQVLLAQLKKSQETEATAWTLVQDSLAEAAVNREGDKKLQEEIGRLREKVKRMENRDEGNRRTGGRNQDGGGGGEAGGDQGRDRGSGGGGGRGGDRRTGGTRGTGEGVDVRTIANPDTEEVTKGEGAAKEGATKDTTISPRGGGTTEARTRDGAMP